MSRSNHLVDLRRIVKDDDDDGTNGGDGDDGRSRFINLS